MKNPLTPAGIKPATFRFVAQHLNHCATAVPTTAVIYNQITGTITTLLVLYILLTLMVAVNIISVSKGPVRHTR